LRKQKLKIISRTLQGIIELIQEKEVSLFILTHNLYDSRNGEYLYTKLKKMYKSQKIARKENTKIYFIIYSEEDISLMKSQVVE